MGGRLAMPRGGALLVAVLAAGCATSELANSPPAAGLQCVDDSADCVGKRQAELKRLMADSKRSWVREPTDARAYASGVRLFAFRGKRKELTCEELSVGKREADNAGPTLRGPAGAGLTPAQISRGAMLATEVGRELGVEMTKRCRRT